ncbi:hypothetical protein LCGC14_0465810 [marine sediment metagenome]|uniref:Uncharacterized protein n=1 Tax=marine sediment metagenome TaxID=412755 RepID=A0A0F9SWL0_9ZZZZ
MIGKIISWIIGVVMGFVVGTLFGWALIQKLLTGGGI